MTVLVMGSTGHVGSGVVAGLRERGVPVRAVSRSERSWPEGVEGYVGDPMADDGLTGAADGVEACFVMSGYAAEGGLLAALAPGTPVVLLSASSAVLGDGGNPLAAMHAGSERAVTAAGHPWTFLRPCSFQSNALRWREQLAEGDVVRDGFADVPVAVIDPADIAAVAVAALTEPGHHGVIHRLSGPEALTPPDRVAVLGEALGRRLSFEAVPDDASMAEIFRRHADLESTVLPTVPDLLGRPAGRFADWARGHAAEF